MANASGISWGVDLYRVVAFVLNSDGSYPITVGVTPFEGLQFEGARAFDITPAEPREIINYGDGRVRDTIFLAPNTSTKGELRVGYEYQDMNVALTGVKQVVTGEAVSVPMGTDKQGTEPIVSLLLMQAAKDNGKLKSWRWYIVPRAQAIPLPASYNENATEMRYQISFSPSTVRLWNEALTEAVHGCTEMAYESGMSEGRPNIVGFQGNGTTDVAFLFPANKPAIATAKIAVYNFLTGVAVTAGITKATTGVTFDVAPAYPFFVFYEY